MKTSQIVIIVTFLLIQSSGLAQSFTLKSSSDFKLGDELTTRSIFWEFNKSKLIPDSYPFLDSLATFLKTNCVVVEIGNHLGQETPAHYSSRPSQSRAESIVEYLTARGIEAHRMTAKGYGFAQPLVPSGNEKTRYLNSRTTIRIIATTSENCILNR